MKCALSYSLAYILTRMTLARLIFHFDLSLANDSKDWIDRQKIYFLWQRMPLNVYLTEAVRKE